MQRRLKWTGVGGVVLCSALQAAAQLVPEAPYRELINPPTPVSGHAVVGAVVLGNDLSTASSRLWLRMADASKVQVALTAVNGRLRGEGVWKLATGGNTHAWEEVQVPTVAGRPQDPRALAIGVQPVSPGSGGTFLLAHLGEDRPTLGPSELRLFVNSRRAEMFLYTSAQAEAVRCAPLTEVQTVRYDVVCDFRLDLQSEGGSRQLTLVRRDGGQTERQQVTLKW